MKFIKPLTMTLFLAISTFANAGTDVAGKVVKFHNNASANSVSVTLDSDAVNPDGCNYSGWYRITSHNPGFDTATTALMTAYVTGKSVTLHLSGCVEYPAITKVTLE